MSDSSSTSKQTPPEIVELVGTTSDNENKSSIENNARSTPEETNDQSSIPNTITKEPITTTNEIKVDDDPQIMYNKDIKTSEKKNLIPPEIEVINEDKITNPANKLDNLTPSLSNVPQPTKHAPTPPINNASYANDSDSEFESRSIRFRSHSGTFSMSAAEEHTKKIFNKTKLRHQESDVEIGANDATDNVLSLPRLPSISYNNIEKDLSELRRASRRKWWSPTRLCDWCMHKVCFGRILIMIMTWTTVVDYGKDLYVAYHLGVNERWWELILTLAILFLSLRLMIYLLATDSVVTIWKILIFYFPGSVLADFQIDRASDIGVCIFWELGIFFLTPFMPFYLIYLAGRKSHSLFSQKYGNFENPHLLAYAVVEGLFETVPQLTLQSYLYFGDRGSEIQPVVFYIAWAVSLIVLIKIPVITWYNWRIVYKLSFKRRHAGEITCLKYHPIQDIVATGSFDHTVLISSVIEDTLKAKRVLDHHYHINSIAWMPKFLRTLDDNSTDILAVAGMGIELFNWRNGQSIAQFPKSKERDVFHRKKRLRTKEVKEVVFSPDGRRVIWCQGKSVHIWDLDQKKVVLKIKCIQGNRLGDVMSIDISPNGKYIAVGLYHNDIKIYNSYNKDIVRLFEGHKSAVNTVKFDRQGKYLISGSSDASVRVWDIRKGEQIKQFDGHEHDVMSVAIDYSNKYVASVGRDQKLFITYLETPLDLKVLKKPFIRTINANVESAAVVRNNNSRDLGDIGSAMAISAHASNVSNDSLDTNHSKILHVQIVDNKSDVLVDKAPLQSLKFQQIVRSDSIVIESMMELRGFTPFCTNRDISSVDFSPYGDFVACADEEQLVHLLPLPVECFIHAHRVSTCDTTNPNISNAMPYDPKDDFLGVVNLQCANKIGTDFDAPPDPNI